MNGTALTDSGEPGTFSVKGKVISVVPADQREVPAAMAEVADCGDRYGGHRMIFRGTEKIKVLEPAFYTGGSRIDYDAVPFEP